MSKAIIIMDTLLIKIVTLFSIIWMVCGETNAKETEELEKLLKNDRLQFDEMTTSYIPIPMLNEEIWPNAQLSIHEKYDSFSKYPSKMSFNSLIGRMDDIEVILSENDIELTQQLKDGFEKQLSHTLKDINLDRYWQFIEAMSGGKAKMSKTKYKTDKYPPFNMNGASSDYRYVSSQTESTGMTGEYWSVSQQCIKHKGCNVYPIYRIIHKTQPFSRENQHLSFSCSDILTLLLPQIYQCIDEHGINKCPLIIDSGHFRWVLKAKIPGTNEYIVIKIMKQTSKENPRDLLRHLRESIFLYYLRKQELAFMDKYKYAFKSNLNEKRAFPFVYELGHCIYPHYISISHYYNMTIEKFVSKGYALNANISELIKISLHIAKGIELLHNIYGGPYHHTDIRDDQFMIDNNGNVLINDFNRGKFQPYFFPKYDYNVNGNIEKCNFCPHQSNGAIRAPEEQISRNLDESIDIYSAAATIWNLFSNERMFPHANGDNIRYLVYDTVRRPSMPSNMPFAFKQVIQSALSHDPKRRPNAKQFRKAIQNIYDNVDKYTRNQQDVTSYYARKHQIFRDTNYPRVSKDFPEFKGKSGDT